MIMLNVCETSANTIFVKFRVGNVCSHHTSTHAVFYLDVKMGRSVPDVDSVPSANKKGLRIKVTGVELDENNNLKSIHIDYSGFHERGGAVIEVSDRNKIELPEE